MECATCLEWTRTNVALGDVQRALHGFMPDAGREKSEFGEKLCQSEFLPSHLQLPYCCVVDVAKMDDGTKPKCTCCNTEPKVEIYLVFESLILLPLLSLVQTGKKR